MSRFFRRNSRGLIKMDLRRAYGYVIGKVQNFVTVPEQASVINQIFEFYNQSWDYLKIANRLAELGISTPHMSEKNRKENASEECRRETKPHAASSQCWGFWITTFTSERCGRANSPARKSTSRT